MNGMLAAGDAIPDGSGGKQEVVSASANTTRAMTPGSPAASVPNSGLSAGEQPGGATDRGAEPQAPGGPDDGVTVRPAPAEKPFVPDWKKGKSK